MQYNYNHLSDDSIQDYLDALPTYISIISIKVKGLTVLPSLSRFTSLTILVIDGGQSNSDRNNVDKITDIPNSVKIFRCIHTTLVEVPTLPENLIELYIQYTNISKLPVLPATLLYLQCSYNNLTGLPELPLGLLDLYCTNNKIEIIPKLPATLVYLDCDYNKIEYIPKLPETLVMLDCTNNCINLLPDIPEECQEIYIRGNPLSQMPEMPIFSGISYEYSRIIRKRIRCIRRFRELYYKKFIRAYLWRFRERKVMEDMHPDRISKLLVDGACFADIDIDSAIPYRF